MLIHYATSHDGRRIDGLPVFASAHAMFGPGLYSISAAKDSWLRTRSIIHILYSPMDFFRCKWYTLGDTYHYKLQDFKIINLIHMISILNFIFTIILYAMR
jgi:hypothetical protein